MKDPVTPALALAVLQRDGGCVAPRLGGSYADCAGRNRLEHVKAEPRMGKRAEARADRLVTLCEGHTEPGMKAGTKPGKSKAFVTPASAAKARMLLP